MQEYPVVKVKEIRNYTIGDVVRIKKTGDLVVICRVGDLQDCLRCSLYHVDGCQVKSGCELDDVYFNPVKE
jgi:hypothetical protein